MSEIKISWILITISLAIISVVDYSIIINLKSYFPIPMVTFWTPVSMCFTLGAIFSIQLTSGSRTTLVTIFLCILSTLACPFVWISVINYILIGEFVINSYWIKWQGISALIMVVEVYYIARILKHARKS